MEDLAPPLKFILALRMGIENGDSISRSIRRFIEDFPENEFSILLESWLLETSTTRIPGVVCRDTGFWTAWRQMVLDLLGLGLQGAPILEEIIALERDLIHACENQVSEELQALPFWALIPILIFQFPAYLILLIGPWFHEFLVKLS